MTSVSRGEERRESREGKSDMTKFYMILGVVAVVGIAAIGYTVRSNSMGSAVSEPIVIEGLEGDMERLVELAQGVTKGDEDAPITIVEFGDYQCPGCGGFAMSVKPQIELMLVETGRARFVFYDYPLTQIHPNAFLAARAARCAEDQGRFWEYHDLVFRSQTSWSADQNAVGSFIDYAGSLSLDEDTFEGCLRSDRHADVVTANMQLGAQLGVSGTPTVLINGGGGLRRIGNYDYQSILSVIEELEAAAASEPTGD